MSVQHQLRKSAIIICRGDGMEQYFLIATIVVVAIFWIIIHRLK